MKRYFALLILVISVSVHANAQRGYQPAKPGKLEGVEIAYKVVPVHFYNPNGAQCIVMRFDNQTASDKEIIVEGELNQLTGMMQTEDFRGVIEVPAMKKRRGKLNGLVFEPSLFEKGKVLEFEIEFNFEEDHK